MMRLALLYFLFFSLNVVGQTPDYSMLQGQWQLQSVTRNNGTIIYYDWNTSKALNVSPVLWAFKSGIGAILNDTTATPDKLPTDTVEASHYAFSGDTLILNNYYSKGEAETATNAPVVYYQIAKIDTDNLLLILYDTVYGKFRPSDQYSKRYVFKRVVIPDKVCFEYNLRKYSTSPWPKDSLYREMKIDSIVAGIDSCVALYATDTFTVISGLGLKCQLFFEMKKYARAAECYSTLIPLLTLYSAPRGGDNTGGRVSSELYFNLGVCQIKTGRNNLGCENIKKAIAIRPNDRYSEQLKKLCN